MAAPVDYTPLVCDKTLPFKANPRGQPPPFVPQGFETRQSQTAANPGRYLWVDPLCPRDVSCWYGWCDDGLPTPPKAGPKASTYDGGAGEKRSREDEKDFATEASLEFVKQLIEEGFAKVDGRVKRLAIGLGVDTEMIKQNA